MDEFKEGDLAVVTTRSGRKYLARYTLAPGIDYFWNPLPGMPKINSLVDPDVEVIKLPEPIK